MRRGAKSVAKILASQLLHTDPSGRQHPVSPGPSRKVLERGFAAMLRNNCRPVTLRLTTAEAVTLPGFDPDLGDADWWAAFGLDVERRATFVMRGSVVRGLNGPLAADLVEVDILAVLAAACNHPGNPTGKWWTK